MKESMIDDSEFDNPVYSPVCTLCVHLKAPLREHRCAAFNHQSGIPLEIWNGQNNHQQPYAGDNGIQFESIRSLTEPMRPSSI